MSFLALIFILDFSNSEFEAWSIDDRMIRPMSTIQQKSALLTANLRDKGQRSTHESYPSQQHNNTASSPKPQPQHHLGASLSSQSVAQNQSPTNTSESPVRRQWQLRSYSAVSKESADRAGRKTASNMIRNRKSISGNHTSLSGSGSNTQGSTQSAAKEGGGSSLYTLRRTRSAPILASGQLSCMSLSYCMCKDVIGHASSHSIVQQCSMPRIFRCRYFEGFYQGDIDTNIAIIRNHILAKSYIVTITTSLSVCCLGYDFVLVHQLCK